MTAQLPAVILPETLAPLGELHWHIGRNEAGIERALGKDVAEMIGQSQRDEEGVCHRTSAEDGRQRDAREKRQAAHGQNAVENG